MCAEFCHNLIVVHADVNARRALLLPTLSAPPGHDGAVGDILVLGELVAFVNEGHS